MCQEYEDYEIEIGCALFYIKKMYRRIYKVSPMIHFRDNMVKYDLMSLWCFNPNTCNQEEVDKLVVLMKILIKAADRFQEAGPYLVADILDKIPSNILYNKKINALHGALYEILHADAYNDAGVTDKLPEDGFPIELNRELSNGDFQIYEFNIGSMHQQLEEFFNYMDENTRDVEEFGLDEEEGKDDDEEE